MPKFSPTGHIAAGIAGAGVSVDQVAIDLGGGTCWLDDETALYQCNDGLGTSDDHWFLRTYNRITKVKADLEPKRSASFIIAGGGRWQATLANDYGSYGSLGHMPLAGVRAAGFDGTLVMCDHYGIGKGITLYAPDGTITKGDPDTTYHDERVLATDDILYRTDDYQVCTLKGRRFKLAGPAMSPILITLDEGEWLCYWTERLGTIAHPALALGDPNPLVGYVLGPADLLAYNFDIEAVYGNHIRWVYSTTQGERAQDIAGGLFPLTAPRVVLDDPAMRDCVGDLVVIGQSGQAVQVEFRLHTDSGDVFAIRFLDDGVISQPANNALMHTYALTPGTHLLSIRGVGKNGQAIPAAPVTVTVHSGSDAMTRYDSTFSTDAHGYNCYPFIVGGRYIVSGFGGVVVWDLVTGTEYDCKATYPDTFMAPRWQCAGVHDAETVAVVSGGNSIGFITGYLYNLRTHDLTPSDVGVILPDVNSAQYSEGHWLLGNGRDLWLDGVLLGSHFHWRASMVWPWIVSPVTETIDGVMQVFQHGQASWQFTAIPTPTYALLSVVQGRTFFTWTCASGSYLVEVGPSTVSQTVDVTTSLCRRECAPLVLGGPRLPMLLTGTEHEQAYDGTIEYEAKQGYLREHNESSVITIPSGFVNQVTGVTLVDSWLVVINDMVGHMSAFIVPFSETPAAIPVVPSMLDPVGSLVVTPSAGVAPLLVTTTLTVTQGETLDVRFYGTHVDGPTVRWGGANAMTASGTLTPGGLWNVFARMQGKNGAVVTTASVAVAVAAEAIPPEPTGLRQGIVAGFDDPISTERLAGFVRDGVRGVRCGIGKPPAATEPILAQLARFPSLEPLFVIRANSAAFDELSRVPIGARVEMGNEPNIGDGPGGCPKMTAGQYAAWATTFRDAVAARQLVPYWGCPSNLNREGLEWLSDVLHLCPWMGNVSVHRYNYGRVPSVQASPWGGRMAEMRELLAVIGTRPYRVTEIGCKCGPACYTTGWWIFKQVHAITEQQQLDYLRAETSLWRVMATCEAVYYYQERSGEVSDYGFNSRYTVEHPDGVPRKAWQVFRG